MLGCTRKIPWGSSRADVLLTWEPGSSRHTVIDAASAVVSVVCSMKHVDNATMPQATQGSTRVRHGDFQNVLDLL